MNPKPYLDRTYGNNWNEIAYQLWDHENKKDHEPREVKIFDRSPAAYDTSKLFKSVDHQAIAQAHLNNKTDDMLHADWNFKEFFPHIYMLTLGFGLDPSINISEQDKEVIVNSKKRLANTIEHHKNFGLKESDIEPFHGTFGRVHDALVADLKKTFGLTHEEAAARAKILHTRMNGNYKHLKPGPELMRQYKSQIGCYLSHYRMIKDASDKYNEAIKELWKLKKEFNGSSKTDAEKQELNQKIAHFEKQAFEYSTILIFEDDDRIGIVEDRLPESPRFGKKVVDEYKGEKLGKIFRKSLTQLSKDWDMLYFLAGGDFEAPTAEQPNLKRLKSGQICTAFAIHARAYDKILKHLEKIKDISSIILPVDKEIAQLHPGMKAFVIHPAFSYTGTDSTITSNGQTSTDKLFDQVTQNDPEHPWQ